MRISSVFSPLGHQTGRADAYPILRKEGRLIAMAKVPAEAHSRAAAALWELLIPCLCAGAGIPALVLTPWICNLEGMFNAARSLHDS